MNTVGRGQGLLETRESIPRFASADHMPQTADIQPFAVTEFQVGRKQYQKYKGSSWTKGQRPVN